MPRFLLILSGSLTTHIQTNALLQTIYTAIPRKQTAIDTAIELKNSKTLMLTTKNMKSRKVHMSPYTLPTYYLKKNRLWLVCLCASLLLSACGGQSDNNTENSLTAGTITQAPQNNYSSNCISNFNQWSPSPEKPAIQLLGNKVELLEMGETYIESGALASDEQDGDLTTSIVIVGAEELTTTTQGDHMIRYEVTDSDGNSALPIYRIVRVFKDTPPSGSKRLFSEVDSVMEYWEHLPTFLGDDPNRLYPLVVYAHGWSTSKEFETSSRAALLDTLPIVQIIKTGEWDNSLPMVVVTPQRCWSSVDQYQMDALNTFINWMVRNYPIDEKRIYLTGLSNGAWVTWEYLRAYPNVIAAAAPIAGYGDHTQVCTHKHVPLWAFNAVDDPTTHYPNVVNMVSNLLNCGVGRYPPKLTIFENGGHIISDDIYNLNFLNLGLPEYDIYDQSIFEWFLEHERH
ncbi:immunoglobulin-like domain-containing protein [Teredinibacter franksiae]|uniref:immunoglobulin-like domain-containing protein n=1 Tax=Teredinibacter franksiae TaxID=2761453 RepID=UPI00162A36DE|nr:immunoglobulin-like domain-containing protein [Teredinibacter franksiae]